MAVRRHVQAGQGQRCKQLENKARGRRAIRSERGERQCWLWPDSCTNTLTLLSFTPQDAGFLRRSNSGKEPCTGVKIREGRHVGISCSASKMPRQRFTESARGGHSLTSQLRVQKSDSRRHPCWLLQVTRCHFITVQENFSSRFFSWASQSRMLDRLHCQVKILN